MSETKEGKEDYLEYLRLIKKRPEMFIAPSPRDVNSIYLLDRAWAAARKDVPRVCLVSHLAKLKGTGSCFATPKDIGFEEALDELIKLVEEH